MEFSFPAHVALLDRFLDRSQHIVEDVESRLLNVQGKRGFPLGDRNYLEQALSSCFFDSAGDLGRLKGQLSSAHRADGFEPVQQEGGAHDFNPAQLVAFAHSYWSNSRWPGRNGRMAHAQTIYSIFVLNQLQQLSLRIWNDGNACATPHLAEIQRLLDRLNDQSSSNVFLRTSPWLLQTAQGPLTRLAHPYFIVAEHISESFEEDVRLEIHRAAALLAGGHLRSQLRYRSRESQRSIDDPEILSVTRNSNSMDVALLIRDLVPLLEAYRRACGTDAQGSRTMLADAILQGLSADTELLLTRLDVLGPATMVEDTFIQPKKDGEFGYTHVGSKHLDFLSKYRDLISDVAGPLREDAQHFEPTPLAYSPFGIVYGFCADILSNIAIAKLVSPETLTLTLEDVFTTGTAEENKLEMARQWEALPRHNPKRVRFEYSAEWGTEIFSRLVAALGLRAMHGTLPNASGLPGARVLVVQENQVAHSGSVAATTVSAQEHCVTSDLKRALATGWTAFPRSQILSDRREGRFLGSVELESKWFAVSKVLLTTHVCRGRDALITDVPGPVIEILRLTCRELVGLASP